MDAETGTGATEVVIPPRVHGSAPDPEAAAAIAKAFALTFQSGFSELDDCLEDAGELGPLLEQAGRQRGAGQYAARVGVAMFGANSLPSRLTVEDIAAALAAASTANAPANPCRQRRPPAWWKH